MGEGGGGGEEGGRRQEEVGEAEAVWVGARGGGGSVEGGDMEKRRQIHGKEMSLEEKRWKEKQAAWLQVEEERLERLEQLAALLTSEDVKISTVTAEVNQLKQKWKDLEAQSRRRIKSLETCITEAQEWECKILSVQVLAEYPIRSNF